MRLRRGTSFPKRIKVVDLSHKNNEFGVHKLSLTSLIDDKSSTVRRFMEEQFPNTRSVLRAVNTHLRNADTIRPLGNPPWMTLGTAFDYRARYLFKVARREDLIAWKGAARLSDEFIMVEVDDNAWVRVAARKDGPQLPKTTIEDFFANLEGMLNELRPCRRVLSPEEEGLLNQYCYVLALFEDSGRGRINPNSPLFGIENPTPERLLELAQPAWVEDLSALGSRFAERYAGLQTHQLVMNPIFEGSADVGGADGDMIIDGCLIDLKCTVRPNIKKEWLFQILGYSLLDYSDTFEMRTVAFYMARQGKTVSWDLGELLARLSDGAAPNLPELRETFLQVLRLGKG